MCGETYPRFNMVFLVWTVYQYCIIIANWSKGMVVPLDPHNTTTINNMHKKFLAQSLHLSDHLLIFAKAKYTTQYQKCLTWTQGSWRHQGKQQPNANYTIVSEWFHRSKRSHAWPNHLMILDTKFLNTFKDYSSNNAKIESMK